MAIRNWRRKSQDQDQSQAIIKDDKVHQIAAPAEEYRKLWVTLKSSFKDNSFYFIYSLIILDCILVTKMMIMSCEWGTVGLGCLGSTHHSFNKNINCLRNLSADTEG
jgi:hypothetical protein